MQTASEHLPDDPEQLREIIIGLQSSVDEWQAKYQDILEQFRLAQQRQFGKRGEAANQLGLFNEGEEIDASAASR